MYDCTADYLVKFGKDAWYSCQIQVQHNQINLNSSDNSVSGVVLPLSCVINIIQRRSKLIISAIPKINSRRESIEILVAGETKNLLRLFTTLTSLISEERRKQESRKLLVYINPFSGKGEARSRWDRVQKIMVRARVQTHVIITEYQNHARNHVRNVDLSLYSGVVTVSGDGLFHEVLNGMYGRADWQQIRQKFNFGIVPGGSGNAIHCSILYQMKESFNDEVMVSALNLARGKAVDADFMECETENGKFVSMFGISWGLIPDCDINSEVIRWAGFMRVYLYLVYRLAIPRSYSGKIHYLPRNSAVKEIASLPKLNEKVPEDWKTIEGKFLTVYACKQSWLDYTSIIVPQAKLDDANIYLVVMSGSLSRIECLKYLLNPTGEHCNGKVFVLPVSAFRFEIEGENDPLTVDAERLKCKVVQGRMVSSGCKMLINMPDSDQQ